MGGGETGLLQVRDAPCALTARNACARRRRQSTERAPPLRPPRRARAPTTLRQVRAHHDHGAGRVCDSRVLSGFTGRGRPTNSPARAPRSSNCPRTRGWRRGLRRPWTRVIASARRWRGEGARAGRQARTGGREHETRVQAMIVIVRPVHRHPVWASRPRASCRLTQGILTMIVQTNRAISHKILILCPTLVR